MKIEIWGALTRAKKSSAGNMHYGKGILTMTIDGGLARLHLVVGNEYEGAGTASMRLDKAQAAQLIKALAAHYSLTEKDI
jgi:hypothetical protein